MMSLRAGGDRDDRQTVSLLFASTPTYLAHVNAATMPSVYGDVRSLSRTTAYALLSGGLQLASRTFR